MTLHIAGGVDLPDTAVTETFGILAVKRAGKSNAAVVMAEEMFNVGLPWVAVDPKGDWWGVRSSGDGKGPGLSVLVFGGEHADVPLEPTSGNLVADLVAEQHLTCVLDVSEMSKADQRRFLRDFATRLYKVNREPLHVFCEEADEYIPQVVRGETAQVVGAFETLVKRGGFRGIGVTLITQRSASLNKDVLTQVGTLIVLRTTSPQDRKAVLGWVEVHTGGSEAVNELPALANGEAYVYSPEWLRALTRTRFRRRHTFDSGATPVVGQRRRQPVTVADVDLAAIKEAMAETVRRAEASDPKHLQARVRQLEKELAAARATVPEPVVERVEVPVLSEDLVLRLEKALQPATGLLAEVQERLAWEVTQRGEVMEFNRRLSPRSEPPILEPPLLALKKTAPCVAPMPVVPYVRDDDKNKAVGSLNKAEGTILAVLALFPAGRTKRQLALQAGYSAKGGGFNNALSSLRTRGLIERGDPVVPTAAGLAAAGNPEPLPDDLVAYWVGQVPKAEGLILQALADAYPSGLDKATLAELTGYSASGGGFNNALSRLRTLQLISGSGELRADEGLFEGARR